MQVLYINWRKRGGLILFLLTCFNLNNKHVLCEGHVMPHASKVARAIGSGEPEFKTIGHFLLPVCTCENESPCDTPFIWKRVLSTVHFMQSKNYFHIKIYTWRLILKQRHKVTRKWPIYSSFQYVVIINNFCYIMYFLLN